MPPCHVRKAWQAIPVNFGEGTGGGEHRKNTSSGAISNVANIPGSTDMWASGKRHDDEKSKR